MRCFFSILSIISIVTTIKGFIYILWFVATQIIRIHKRSPNPIFSYCLRLLPTAGLRLLPPCLQRLIQPQMITIIQNIHDLHDDTTRQLFRARLEASGYSQAYDDPTDEDEDDQDEDTEDDDETDYDSDDDIDIITSEIQFDDTEKVHGKYYIGIPILLEEGFYLLNASISRRSFFAFEYSRVLLYTRQISTLRNLRNAQLEILQLNIHSDGTYEVFVKTHWIRIIQRRWKYVYSERVRILRTRGSLRHQEYFRIHGKYMAGYRNLPSLMGMLDGALIRVK